MMAAVKIIIYRLIYIETSKKMKNNKYISWYWSNDGNENVDGYIDNKTCIWCWIEHKNENEIANNR